MRLVIKLVEKNWNNCTTKISLQKGFRGNIAGDGPQAKCKKQLGLDKNGIALNIVGRRTNGKYTVTEIFPEVRWTTIYFSSLGIALDYDIF